MRVTRDHPVARATALGLSVLFLLTGCGADTSGSGSVQAGPVSGADVAGKGPWNLVGSWLLDADGEPSGTVLRLAPGELSLWRDCDVLDGSWHANENGMFVGYVSAGFRICDDTPPGTPKWLVAAVAFVLTDDGASLLDARGDVVAELRPGGRPTAGPNIARSEAEPPELSERGRRTFPPAEPLPEGLVAADAGSLAGRWLPVDSGNSSVRPERPRLDLKAEGGWTASDGCNETAGRWLSGPDGAFLAVSGGSTLIGCHNVSISAWLQAAARAGFDGDVLVLVDRAGHETGRLRRG